MEERITSLTVGLEMDVGGSFPGSRQASAISHSSSLHRMVLIFFKYSEITPDWPLLPDYYYDTLHVR